MSLRLCSLAPWTTSSSLAIRSQSSPGRQREQVFVLAPVAAPGPVLGARAETGSDRVVQDVCASLSQVVVVTDHPAVEAVAKQVARPAVTLVELLGVGPVQDLHASRQRLELGLDDQVIVIAHQAERVEVPGEAAHDDPEQAQEMAPVL